MLTRHLTAVASGLSKRNMASLASAYRAPIPTSEYVAPSNAVATTVLDNGVKVVSVAGGKTFPSIVVDINAGSSYETYETAGTFHFLKYFAYKSTQTLSGLRSTRLIEDLTQKYVVKNGREEFTYTAVLNGAEEAKDFLQLQADILRPRVQEWEVNEVRDLVQHDAEVKSNDPTFKLNNAVHETAFRSQGIGRPVFAPAYNLDNINETVLRQHVDDFFVGSRIAVVGNSVAEHDRFVKYVADSLGQLPTAGRAIAKEESKYFGGELRQAAPGGTSITLAYPTKGFAEGYISYVILKLLGSSRGVHPGSGLTSRLYAVGQKHAWAQFDPYLVFHANNGFLGVKGRSGSAGKAELLASTLEAELRRLSTEAVSKQELDRAVRAANIAFANWSDSALSHATFTASNTLHHGQALGPAALTPADIQTFAKKLLANRPTVVAFGDSTGLLPR